MVWATFSQAIEMGKLKIQSQLTYFGQDKQNSREPDCHVKFFRTMDVLFILFVFCLKLIFCKDYYFDDSKGLGRRFDGVGAISGGGATSKLLVNYPELHRSDILDFLFKPNYGASLQILKVEIGGDAQSSEGTEASHMHEEWDENYKRGYEWWLMVEAKKRNPSIVLCGLAWGYPSWLGEGSWDPYVKPNKTAHYIYRWIWGAKTYYDLDIDCIGIWNEKPYNVEYIKILRRTLDANGFKRVKIIASDNIPPAAWSIVDDMKQDQQLNNSVDYIGVHYSGTYSTDDAQECGKPIWSSEDWSNSNDDQGAGCMARLLNQNYLYGKMTSLIAWNMIESYYHDLPYGGHGLMVANQPWSGYYEVSPPIWATAHTTQFTEIGWNYLMDANGVTELKEGGTIVALLSPNRKNMTIVIETMDTSKNEFCLRYPAKPTPVSAQNVTLNFKGSMASVTSLNLWQSKIRGNQSTYLKYIGVIKVNNGQLTLSLDVNSIYTLTSLATGKKGDAGKIPESKSFPIPYEDNFDSYPDDGEAFHFTQQVGVFEIHSTSDAKHKKVMRQVVTSSPIHWCPILLSQPFGVIGNHNWSNVEVKVDVMVNEINGTKGIFVGVRVDQGGCTAFLARGIFFFIIFTDQTFLLSKDLERTDVIHSGKVSVAYNQWHTMNLKVKDNIIIILLDSVILYNVTSPSIASTGFVGLGTDNFGLADFDNLSINPTSS